MKHDEAAVLQEHGIDPSAQRVAVAQYILHTDAHIEDHHHFIDDDSGQIHDIPWDAIPSLETPKLSGFVVREFQIVMRGKLALK